MPIQVGNAIGHGVGSGIEGSRPGVEHPTCARMYFSGDLLLGECTPWAYSIDLLHCLTPFKPPWDLS